VGHAQLGGRFGGKSAVITGGGGGIGCATALRLASEGAAIAVLDRRLELAERTAQLVRDAGGTAQAFHCDVTNETSVNDTMSAAVDALGGIDVLHVNQGTLQIGSLADITLAQWNHVMDVNLTGSFLILRAALPRMISGGGGAVVTTASIEAFGINTRSPASASYPASKGGLLMLTRKVAVEYAEHKIRANAVCPGPVKTDMLAHVTEDFPGTPGREVWGTKTLPFQPPDNEPAVPADIAAAVAFLASCDARKITGSVIMVDGGWSAI
jgi:NAD(P)-dependent dehydrogenase (short-subunit alcohol dehydrogenase family)